MHRRRLLLTALAGPVVALALAATAPVRIEHDSRSLLRADAAAEAREAELRARFGSEDILLLAWEVPSALDPDVFDHLRTFTREVAALGGLEQVYSLASPTVPLPLDGFPRPIRRADLETPEGRARVRAALLAADPYLGTIVNRDLDVVAVASTVAPGTRAEREAVLRRVRALAAAQERHVHVAGVTALSVDAGAYALADLRRTGALACAVAVLLLGLLCASWKETVLAAAATFVPPLFAFGAAGHLGLPFTALGVALFPVLAVAGITSSVHLLNAYGGARRRGADAGAAARAAVRRVRAPVALSLLTTSAAFFSLQATGVPAFRGGGIVVGLGMLVAIPVLLVALPAALALAAPAGRQSVARRLDRPLVRLAAGVLRRPALVAGAGMLVAAAGMFGASRARLRVDILQAFQPESGIAKTYRFLDERLTATVPVDAILAARPDATMTEILDDLRRFERAATAIDGVDSALGLAALVAYGKKASPFEVGDEGSLAVLRTGFAAITARFEDRDGRRYRVKVRVREGTPPAVLGRLRDAAAACTSGEMELVGLYPRAVATTRRILADLARGVGIMLAIVVAVAAAALRSTARGVAAFLPNLLPPAAVFGAAALLGIPLDISAVAVGAVAIGLAVDDTLHVLFHYARARDAGKSRRRAVLETQRVVGRALVVSSLVLVAGLLCLLASVFLPTARFGLFAALSCAAALVADLIVLPAVLRWVD